ncbi:MAG TPA: peptide deformylase [Candidatus Paceibacterota bacterium]|nr:peptide deformylase [Candidatus Paceibacterota bacterium]
MKIVQQGDPVLRGIAKEVPIREITSKEIQKVLSDMKKALHATKDGVAIAAPQIGIPLSIFVVAGKVFDIQEGIYDESKKVMNEDQVYINPVVTKLSRNKEVMEEGCLSVRNIYGKIKRSKKATVEAYDENGKKFCRGASGLLAQVFQHETDHLKGILFVDSAFDLQEITRE